VSKDKGLDVLINAWQLFQQNIRAFRFQSLDFKAQITDLQVPSSIFQARLIIIGSGPYQKTIEDLNDPTIECLGAVDHDKLADYYSSASLVVFPSLLMENQPTVLLEAMSAEINIVASDIGGVGETLNGYGTLVPPGDPEMLALGMLAELQKNPDHTLADLLLSQHDIDTVMKILSASFSE
jgi:glycosyltransferase involved in cell wall biosynthesis